LRSAKIANFNLVPVSSIFPPNCKLVTVSKGLEKMKSGQVVHCVISRNTVDENHRLIAASIGLAIPKDRTQHGYISEHHSFGETEDISGDYAEDLAAMMLATTLGVQFEGDTNWNQKEEIWKMSGKIVRTANITQSAIGRAGTWTTVIAAAVFVA
ncbi:MAG TPA: pyruvoyl-dependent arginine decarboxylase, partial [Elusimicrobiales bacterium]|nr:pyruvoyl-dependent arginine decarboxylase [Elusimicrobiales bacterium]